MTIKDAYSPAGIKDYVHSLSHGISKTALILLFLLPLAFPLTAQTEDQYDEIGVYIRIPYIGIYELDALIKGTEAYLPVRELFTFLKIKNVTSDDQETVTGFFINPDETYSISKQHNQITFNNKVWELEEDALIRTEYGLYLKTGYYGQVFGLDCRFSFRDLMVYIEPRIELPAIREMRQEEMRRNITRLKGEIIADTTIGRTYPGFRFGMADWSVYASEQPGGKSDGRFNLALGSVIAGGEANASLTFYTNSPFDERQQHYMWRQVNNERSWLRQVMIGKINTGATSTLFNPVVGAQVTNTPTTFRRSFGSYTLTDKTDPGWTVELYVNNVLVDYVKADASGFFTFEVPLVYGNTMVKLKFYGPWGEERTREQNITIPFNFMPHKELEYTVSAGFVEDSLWSRFSRTDIRYGATKNITLGGGVEYFSALSEQPFMPFINASVRITGNLLLSGDYTHGVRAKGTMTWRLPSNILLDMNYIRYNKEQKAIIYNYLDEIKGSLSIPVRIKKLGAYSRMTYHRIRFPGTKYTTAEWMLSGSVSRVNINLSSYGMFSEYFDPSLYSQLSLGIRLPADFVIMPQLQYSYSAGELISGRINIEKRVFGKGYLNLTVDHNFRNNLTIGELGMRYDFSFAQAGASIRQTDKQSTFIQYARGSLINDRKTSYLKADNRTNVGRGGVAIIPFLDLNANGVRDPGEPLAGSLAVRSSSGMIDYNEKDSVIHITGMEPYVKHFIEFDESKFPDISWRLRNKSYAVIVDANILKQIEVPVTVEGEATGLVMLEKKGVRSGLSRIIINIHRENGSVVSRTISEPDGYYSYFGLTPGSYYVAVDTAQLGKLDMTAEPDSIPFTIRAGEEGDYVQGLDFILRMKELPLEAVTPPVVAPVSDTARVTPPVIPAVPDTARVTPPVVAPVPDTAQVTPPVVAPIPDTARVIPPVVAPIPDTARVTPPVVPAVPDTARVTPPVVAPIADTARVIPAVPDTARVTPPVVPAVPDTARVTPPVVAPVSDTAQVTPPPVVKTEKDTTYLVIHEEVRELTTITEDYYAVQFGAFRTKLYAEIMKQNVEAALDKNVKLFEEDGFWKVRVTGFDDRDDLEKYIPIINAQGITEIWVIMNKAVKGEWITTTRDDSLAVISERVTEEVMLPAVISGTTIQLGEFTSYEQTMAMGDRLLAAADKLVTIRNEGGVYKVQITGFADTSEVRKFIPLLAEKGFRNITVVPQYGAVMAPVAPIVPAQAEPEEVMEAGEPDEFAPVKPEIVEEIAPSPPPVPRFVLHAGSYFRKAQAERAKQRLQRRLKLPVEIIEEWESYRVVITGFFTREETYPLYPELAGMGFNNIFVYEKPLTER